MRKLVMTLGGRRGETPHVHAGLWCFLAVMLGVGAWSRGEKLVVEVTVPEGTTGEVYLAGSLPHLGPWNPSGVKMNKQSERVFATTLEAPAGFSLEFKFTQGSWATVEKTPNGAEKTNRVAVFGKTGSPLKVEVARWAVAGEAAATRPSTIDGRVDLFEIESLALKNKRKVWVWLPPEYDANVAYPVLYMADGRNVFDEATSSFGREWGMDEAASTLISEGKVRPMIIVGIDHADRRNAEFMGKEMGYGKEYGKFVVSEVKRVIDGQYKTLKGPENTFCGGASLGGLVSLAMVMDYPEVFGGALVVSPSLWAEDQMVMKRAEMGGVKRGAKVYLDMGTAEGDRYVEHARTLAKALERQKAGGVTVKYVEAEGAEHNESAWGARAPGMLEFLFGK